MVKAIIVDFEDSFTHNIASEVSSRSLRPVICHYRSFFDGLWKNFQHQGHCLILGPGPGHPDEYLPYLRPLAEILKAFPMTMGICLGHQILHAQGPGQEIKKLQHPLHGQSRNLILPPWPEFPPSYWGQSVSVQHYNSLAPFGPLGREIENLIGPEGEKMATRWTNGISYQFHPESIGTSCPQLFFHCLSTL